MIRNIFILKNNGICIYYLPCLNINAIHNNKNNVNYPQLISGFFTALDTFAQTVAGYNQYLKFLSLRELNYYFHRENSFFYILETDNINHHMNIDDYIFILKEIAKEFNKRAHLYDIFDESIQIIKDRELDEIIHSKISKTIRRSLFKRMESSNFI